MAEGIFEKAKKYSPILIRLSISAVFLWFGLNQIFDPDNFMGYLPDFLLNLDYARSLVIINGIIETVLGILLAIGFFTRIVAAILAVHLFSISISLGYNDIAVRDWGLTFVTLAIALGGEDEWTLDWKKKEGSMKALVILAMVAMLMLSACTSNTSNPADNSEDAMDEKEETMEAKPAVEEESHEGEMMENTGSNDQAPTEEAGLLGTPDKTFVITGENFKFLMDGVEAPELKANVGDVVRVEFTSTSGFHDWVVDEFNAATKQVRPTDGMTFVEFKVDKAGTFEYYCSVGSHRANGMVGNLVVE